MWKNLSGILSDGNSPLESNTTRDDKPEFKSTSVTATNEVLSLIKSGVEQRSQWQVDVFIGSLRHSFLCTDSSIIDNKIILFYDFGGRRLYVEEGMPATVYFQRNQPGAMHFYAFQGKVMHIFQDEDVRWVMEFAIPDRLELRQRRSSSRVEPSLASIKMLLLWEMPRVEKNSSPPVTEWGEPLLKYVPFKDDQVRVSNISATGIRLRIMREDIPRTDPPFGEGRHYALYFSIDSNLSRTGEAGFWFIIKFNNHRFSNDMVFAEYGSPYVAVGEISKEDGTMRWKVLSQGAFIEKMSKWITGLSL